MFWCDSQIEVTHTYVQMFHPCVRVCNVVLVTAMRCDLVCVCVHAVWMNVSGAKDAKLAQWVE